MLTTIRKATVNDKTRIMEIYAYARQFMAEHGNPNQWKNNNPSEETIDNDIANRQMYVIEADGGVHAVFYFHIGDDSTYHIIDNGQWLSDEPTAQSTELLVTELFTAYLKSLLITARTRYLT